MHKIQVSDEDLIKLYKEGHGVAWLSKHFNVSRSAVSSHLKKAGVLDSTRANPKKQETRNRPRNKEFLDSTKKQRFQECEGRCELCHQLIGDGINWRAATYHHKTPVSKGGDRSAENCMVLHEECHVNNWELLHPGIPNLSRYDKASGLDKADLSEKMVAAAKSRSKYLSDATIIKEYFDGDSANAIAANHSYSVPYISLRLAGLKNSGRLAHEAKKRGVCEVIFFSFAKGYINAHALWADFQSEQSKAEVGVKYGLSMSSLTLFAKDYAAYYGMDWHKQNSRNWNNQKLSDEDMITCRQAKWSTRKISEHYGVPLSSVKYKLKALQAKGLL